MALLANLHRDPNSSQPYSRADFHPLLAEERARQDVTEVEGGEFVDTLARVLGAN